MKKLLHLFIFIIIVSPTVFAQPALQWVGTATGPALFDGSNNSNSIVTDAAENSFQCGGIQPRGPVNSNFRYY
jgi:hypothetical protein